MAEASPQQQQQAPQGVANLANSVLALAALKEYGRKELIEVLDSVRGKKGLVLDPKFSGPLGLIAEVSLLKEHGVEKIYHLNPGRFPTECKNLIYLVRPKVQLMKCIAEHIQGHIQEGQKKEYSVFFVPRRTMICERVLEEEGVYSEITFGEYHLDLIPFDDDVLSLELETSYKECFLEGDRTSLFYVARSLMKLQSLFGVIPNLKGKGFCSKLVIDMLMRMRREMGDEGTLTPEIEELILIDRQADMVTPMCTQLTYEGLIDEIFGINNGYVDLDAELLGGQKGAKKVKTPVNSSDKLYAQLRDLNFSVLGPILNKKAKEIDEYYKQRHGAETVSQIRDFMKRFATAQQEHASLRIHTSIAERVLQITKDSSFHKQLEAEQNMLAGLDVSNEYIEECINRQEPPVKVLRLLCLQSLTNGGVKPKQFEFFKREILQTYGYQYLFTLNNLEKLGLFKRQEGRNAFATLRKSLQLIVEDIDENNPTDVAYVYSGYAPLSVRLVQCALKPGGWRSKEDALRLIPGPTVEEVQVLPREVYDAEGTSSSATRKPVTLVFFIGGLTFTELAALRWLSQQEGQDRDIVVATTKLVNGNTILSSVMENLSAAPSTTPN